MNTASSLSLTPDSVLTGLLKNAIVGVGVIQQKRFVCANPRFAEIFGLPHEHFCEVVSPAELPLPEDLPLILPILEPRPEHVDRSSHQMFRGLHQDGNLLELEAYATVGSDGRDQPFSVLLLLDVSARGQSERTSRQHAVFVQQLIEAIPCPIYYKDSQARFLGCNRAFERVAGMGRMEIIGKTSAELDLGGDGDRHMAIDMGLITHPGQVRYEATALTRDRGLRELFVHKATFQDADGRTGGIVGTVTDVTHLKRTDDLLWRHANFDSLTGLPNRSLFYDRLNECIKRVDRSKQSIAVVLIDLDHFKEINDSLGHQVGDRLLIEVAHRIQKHLRESDTVARLGGDESAIIIPDVYEITLIERLTGALLDELQSPYRLEDESAFTSASMGIAYYPRDGHNPNDLLRNADQAMYQAKARGRNRISYCSTQLQQHALRQRQIGQDLRMALAQQDLRLHFQPIYDLQTGELTRAEALLRWFHPILGPIPPTEFITLAEELDLIDEIGAWVFDSATHSLTRLRAHLLAEGRDPALLQLSVNASPKQFTQGRSLQSLLAHLDDQDLPGDALTIEITEGQLLDSTERNAGLLSRLHARGIHLSIDDFGTGYSSLSYLKSIPLDCLKIDRSFVAEVTHDTNDQAIVEAIVAMGHKLGLKVVAEGIETMEQLQFIRAAGCDFGQGHLFARAVNQRELMQLLAQGPLPCITQT